MNRIECIECGNPQANILDLINGRCEECHKIISTKPITPKPMDYKERLERATLMAMQGVINNNEIQSCYGGGVQAIVNSSFDIAKAILDHIDSQLVNQETQEEQEPKRGQVVWVRDDENGIWLEAKYSEKNDRFYYVYFKTEVQEEYPFIQITTKNPYTDDSTRT